MTPGNFNWFLHTMLFYHTKYVIQKQKKRLEGQDDEEEDLGLDEDIDEDNANEEDANEEDE